jgi:actin-related protein
LLYLKIFPQIKREREKKERREKERKREKRKREKRKREKRKKEERKKEERKREEKRIKSKKKMKMLKMVRFFNKILAHKIQTYSYSKILLENEEEEIPFQFGAMTNQLQICNWLVLHPSILHLANQMLAASSKQPLPSSLPTSSTTSSLSDNVKSIPNLV